MLTRVRSTRSVRGAPCFLVPDVFFLRRMFAAVMLLLGAGLGSRCPGGSGEGQGERADEAEGNLRARGDPLPPACHHCHSPSYRKALEAGTVVCSKGGKITLNASRDKNENMHRSGEGGGALAMRPSG